MPETKGAPSRFAWSFSARCPLWIALIMQMMGCRFGDAPGDGLGISFALNSDGGLETTASREEEAVVPAPPNTTIPAPAEASVSAGRTPSTVSDAGLGMDTSNMPGAPAKADSSAPTTAAMSCGMRNSIQVCDPISNTGCPAELGMQCDVDLFATTLSGVCVFSAPAQDPNSCLKIPPTETCPPQTTCVGQTCRRICVCDLDCESRQRCSMRLGDAGFKVCEAR